MNLKRGMRTKHRLRGRIPWPLRGSSGFDDLSLNSRFTCECAGNTGVPPSERLRVGWLNGLVDLSGRGTTRAEDDQGRPTQSHISPSILVYEGACGAPEIDFGPVFLGAPLQ